MVYKIQYIASDRYYYTTERKKKTGEKQNKKSKDMSCKNLYVSVTLCSGSYLLYANLCTHVYA